MLAGLQGSVYLLLQCFDHCRVFELRHQFYHNSWLLLCFGFFGGTLEDKPAVGVPAALIRATNPKPLTPNLGASPIS